MLRRSLLMVGLVTLAFSGVWAAGNDDNWPQFRGPHAGVAADDPVLPLTWSEKENVVWQIGVPGLGWSSPVVWEDHVFLTSVINTGSFEAPKPGMYIGAFPKSTAEHRWMVYDVDFKTGRIRWQRELRRGPPLEPKHQKNSYASETPVTDGERLYVYFGNVGLFVFDLDGRPLWSKDMGPVTFRNGWGSGSSPVLHKDRVYILNDNDTQSFLAAYDKRTGAQGWRVDREEGTTWATPFVWENEQRTEIVTSGSDKVRSYDVNGKLLWEFSGLSTITIPTPFAKHGLLYISSGYVGDKLRPTYAVRPGASGDISLREGETSNQYIAWSYPTLAPYNPTPLVYGDYYYTLSDRGLLTCHEARTGKEVYGRQRIAVDASGFTASPWAYNGRIFAMSEDGDTYVMQAGPEFKLLGKNTLSDMTLATPAVAHGSLLIRTQSKLYRVATGAGNLVHP